MAVNRILNNISSDMTYAQIIERILGLAASAGYPATNPATLVLDVDNRNRAGAYASATSITVIVGTAAPTTPVATGTLWLDMDAGSATFRTLLVNAAGPAAAPIFYSIASVTGILNPQLGIRTVVGASKTDVDGGNLGGSGGGGGGGGVSDHGALTGLADDDHPQYLNTVRGDGRYASFGSDAFLKAFASNVEELFTGTRTLNADNVVTSSPVTWPDGVTGTFTATSVNATFKCVDAYTVTYAGTTTKTVTQAAVTRNAEGEITTRPALTVA